MSKIGTAVRMMKNDKRGLLYTLFDKANKRCLLHWMNDSLFLKTIYWLRFGKHLNLSEPVDYNEKLQWLKLYDHRPEYVTMVDKIAVKEFVADCIGPEYIIPTLGVWTKPEDIDWDVLPNEFVLKWNHDSGSIVICKNKKSFNREDALKKLSHGAKVNGFWYGREWPYKRVSPLILAEKFMEDDLTKELRDYKVFTFGGKAYMLLVATERQKAGVEVKFDFFDKKRNHLNLINDHANASIIPELPESFDEIMDLAERIAKGYPHLRVDFYEVNGRVYFGEITLYHGSGLMTFKPDWWNRTLGDLIKLPNLM